jgi:hypothetical protein
MATLKKRRKRKKVGRAFLRWSERTIENRQVEFEQRQRAAWSRMVPEITYVLLKCKAMRDRATMRDVTEEAFATYPGAFETWFDGRKIPDYSLVLLTLNEAKRREWGYAAGDWFKGWRLTPKGAGFARNVERRRNDLREKSIARKSLKR